MKSSVFYVDKDNYIPFIYKLFPYFNIGNNDYIEKLYEYSLEYVSYPCSYTVASNALRRVLRENTGTKL